MNDLSQDFLPGYVHLICAGTGDTERINIIFDRTASRRCLFDKLCEDRPA